MILVRHGQSEFNVVYGETRKDPGIRDPKLTALGLRQAAHTAALLADTPIKRVICSPYWRTLQTAQVVAAAFDLPFEINPVVGERAAFTCDIGTTRSSLQKHWPGLGFEKIDEEWWPAMEESENSLDLRCRKFRNSMTRSGDWANTLVITHWGFIRALTGHRVGNCAIVRFDPSQAHPGGGHVVSTPDIC
ncbi:MAG: histidine phosphatase family protein [Alphaproteobacteria bacterium]|nr:histidine phosphatase family protein [Alphaproteobacteria bacterium]